MDTPIASKGEPTRIAGAAPLREEPTRVAGFQSGGPSLTPPLEGGGDTRVVPVGGRKSPVSQEAAGGTRVVPAAARRPQPVQDQPEDEEYEDEGDSVAEALIRWVPPITAIICAAVALCGFVYYQFRL